MTNAPAARHCRRRRSSHISLAVVAALVLAIGPSFNTVVSGAGTAAPQTVPPLIRSATYSPIRPQV